MSFNKNKSHLVPISVIDVAKSLKDPNLKPNQIDAYQARLEAIQEYVTDALDKHKAFRK